MLMLAASQIDQPNEFFFVEGLERPLYVLDEVCSKGVVTMLSVQVEVTNMCQYIASGIKLKRGK
jgi:hypothetical protein